VWTSQAIDALLPQFAAATVDSVELDGDLVTFRVRAKAGDAACSGCRWRSSRVHARHQRQLADLPLGGRRVRVIAQIRRFKCLNRPHKTLPNDHALPCPSGRLH